MLKMASSRKVIGIESQQQGRALCVVGLGEKRRRRRGQQADLLAQLPSALPAAVWQLCKASLATVIISPSKAIFPTLSLCLDSTHPLTFRWLPHHPANSLPFPWPRVIATVSTLLCRTFHFLMMLFSFVM